MKDHTLITMEEMYQRIKTCEDETAKKAKSEGKKRKRVSEASLDNVDDVEGSKKTNDIEILNVIEGCDRVE